MTTCSCGCGKPVVAWGLARACYDRARKAGTLPKRAKLGEAACERCGKVRKLYAWKMCKSCYNTVNARSQRSLRERLANPYGAT